MGIETPDIQHKILEAGFLFLPNGKIVVYLQIVLKLKLRDYEKENCTVGFLVYAVWHCLWAGDRLSV